MPYYQVRLVNKVLNSNFTECSSLGGKCFNVEKSIEDQA
jgi:hypothetical protein